MRVGPNSFSTESHCVCVCACVPPTFHNLSTPIWKMQVRLSQEITLFTLLSSFYPPPPPPSLLLFSLSLHSSPGWEHPAPSPLTLWSSSFVQGPFTSSGLSTFCQRCWHWPSVLFCHRATKNHLSTWTYSSCIIIHTSLTQSFTLCFTHTNTQIFTYSTHFTLSFSQFSSLPLTQSNSLSLSLWLTLSTQRRTGAGSIHN